MYRSAISIILHVITVALLQLALWVWLSIGTLRTETLTFLVLVFAAPFPPSGSKEIRVTKM